MIEKQTAAQRRTANRRQSSGGEDSAGLLLRTAERLFAEKGIDAVSMREIAREAKQRNNSALLYHFGSKQLLVHAIVKQRVAEVDILRNALLDRLEAEEGALDLHALAGAIVQPLATNLEAGGSTTYIRFLAWAQMRPDLDLVAVTREEGERGFNRVLAHLHARLPDMPPSVLRQRFLAGVSFVMFSLADYERLKLRRSASDRSFDVEKAIANLTDMLAGALGAGVSESVSEKVGR